MLKSVIGIFLASAMMVGCDKEDSKDYGYRQSVSEIEADFDLPKSTTDQMIAAWDNFGVSRVETLAATDTEQTISLLDVTDQVLGTVRLEKDGDALIYHLQGLDGHDLVVEFDKVSLKAESFL